MADIEIKAGRSYLIRGKYSNVNPVEVNIKAVTKTSFKIRYATSDHDIYLTKYDFANQYDILEDLDA